MVLYCFVHQKAAELSVMSFRAQRQHKGQPRSRGQFGVCCIAASPVGKSEYHTPPLSSPQRCGIL